jgi:hypothetical protein
MLCNGRTNGARRRRCHPRITGASRHSCPPGSWPRHRHLRGRSRSSTCARVRKATLEPNSPGAPGGSLDIDYSRGPPGDFRLAGPLVWSFWRSHQPVSPRHQCNRRTTPTVFQPGRAVVAPVVTQRVSPSDVSLPGGTSSTAPNRRQDRKADTRDPDTLDRPRRNAAATPGPRCATQRVWRAVLHSCPIPVRGQRVDSPRFGSSGRLNGHNLTLPATGVAVACGSEARTSEPMRPGSPMTAVLAARTGGCAGSRARDARLGDTPSSYYGWTLTARHSREPSRDNIVFSDDFHAPGSTTPTGERGPGTTAGGNR